MKLVFLLIAAFSLSCTKQLQDFKIVHFDFSAVASPERYQLKFTDGSGHIRTIDSNTGSSQYHWFRNGVYTIELVEVVSSACSPGCYVSDTVALTRGNPVAVAHLQNEYVLNINCR